MIKLGLILGVLIGVVVGAFMPALGRKIKALFVKESTVAKTAVEKKI
jgi:hypothetical protein